VNFDAGVAETKIAADVAFCCLGTTIKRAGSKPAFYKVDHDYVAESARFSKQAGVRHFSLVTSVGANASSNNFYLRVKGEAERTVSDLGFRSVSIFRPSILEAARPERRCGELFGICCVKYCLCCLFACMPKYDVIKVLTVAQAMVNDAVIAAGGPSDSDSRTPTELRIFDGSGVCKEMANGRRLAAPTEATPLSPSSTK